MKTKAITRMQLDAKECGCKTKKCDHSILYLHPACHMRSPSWVSYKKGSGELSVTCAECNKIIAKIAVAEPMARN